MNYFYHFFRTIPGVLAPLSGRVRSGILQLQLHVSCVFQLRLCLRGDVFSKCGCVCASGQAKQWSAYNTDGPAWCMWWFTYNVKVVVVYM